MVRGKRIVYAELKDAKKPRTDAQESGPKQSNRRLPNTISGGRSIGCPAGWMRFSKGREHNAARQGHHGQGG